MTYVIGAIMALGALFGIVKIMYGVVRARTREIGTLRAMGFGATPVVVSVLAEAALLGAIGALLGAAIAWLIFDGRDMWVWGAFKLHVSPALWLLGLVWALTTVAPRRIPAGAARRTAAPIRGASCPVDGYRCSQSVSDRPVRSSGRPLHSTR